MGLFYVYGAPEGIRTPDRSVRSRVLYPAELQAQILLSVLRGTHYLGLLELRQFYMAEKEGFEPSIEL